MDLPIHLHCKDDGQDTFYRVGADLRLCQVGVNVDEVTGTNYFFTTKQIDPSDVDRYSGQYFNMTVCSPTDFETMLQKALSVLKGFG